MATKIPEGLTVVIDTREQDPFNLEPLPAVVETLSVGDYSIKGLEHVVSLERKSLMDFVACCGRERDRFQRELDRLRGWQVSAVIVETSWEHLESGQWKTSRMKMTPNHVMGSATSWISQGHNLILAPKASAERIARSILIHAARHRLNEVAAFAKAIRSNR